MSFQLILSLNASKDISEAVGYYNAKVNGLGTRLILEADAVLNQIAVQPETFSIRYKSVRAAKLKSFPYLIFYKINDKDKIVFVLRIFNTHQRPFWEK